MIPGVPVTFLSVDSVDEAEVNKLNYPLDLLNSMTGTASLFYHTLTLKKGYAVILLCILQLKNGQSKRILVRCSLNN